VCTEAGLCALRAQRGYCLGEDFMKGCRKIKEAKKLESAIDYHF